MASITKRPDGKYRARYRDKFNREHAKHFALKKDAQRWLNEVTTSVVTGQYVDPKAAKELVRAISKAYLSGHPDWTASTRARNESIIKMHILPKWGETRVGDIDHTDLQTWVGELGKSLAGGTVRKVAGVLSGILDEAVASKRLASNPMASVKLPKQSLAKRRYLSAIQIEALVESSAAIGTDRDLMIHALAYCGLRIGELAALRVRHVDLLRKRFRIEESVTEVNGKLVWSSPKDHQRRSVPFPDFMGEQVKRVIRDRSPDDLLFPAPRGGVLRVRGMRRDWFDAACAKAGVSGLTPHELRHTCASLAVASGASVLALQRMLGHDKPSTTLDVYADLFDEDLDLVAGRLDEARAQAVLDAKKTEFDSRSKTTKKTRLARVQ